MLIYLFVLLYNYSHSNSQERIKMDALNLLTTRRSSKKLTTPAPNAEQLEQMLQAATQVPDHGNMRPYRFTVIQSEAGLQRFRELLSNTVTELNFGEDAMKKAERVGNSGAYDYRRYIYAKP